VLTKRPFLSEQSYEAIFGRFIEIQSDVQISRTFITLMLGTS
jgi:hypothetical protein